MLISTRYLQPFSGLLAAREGIIDMSGPTANFSPFLRRINVVLALASQALYMDAFQGDTLNEIWN